jgi:hypothetical protein
MTHPDPALNQPSAQPAADVLVADESVLSSVSPAVRAAQDLARAGIGKHVQLEEAVRQVHHVGGAFYSLKTSLRSFVAMLPGLHDADDSAVFLRSMSATTKSLDLVQSSADEQEASENLSADDHVEYGQDVSESKKAA